MRYLVARNELQRNVLANSGGGIIRARLLTFFSTKFGPVFAFSDLVIHQCALFYATDLASDLWNDTRLAKYLTPGSM